MDGKLATITVTYNRKQLVIENIQEILSQTYKADAIIIIDNHSTDGTKDAILKKFPDANIKYVYLNENTGGAGGFYHGCKYAYENGYDWMILMDDDGKLKRNDSIEKLIQAVDNQKLTFNDKVIYNSVVLCDDEKLSFGLFDIEGNDTLQTIKEKAKNNIIEGKINPFNGTLISKGLVKEIGFPNKDFFIKHDEMDYHSRAISANAHIATVTNSLYFHPMKLSRNYKILNLFGKKYMLFLNESPWQEYYKTRNAIYSYKNSKSKKFVFIYIIIKILSLIKCKVSDKRATVKMAFKGLKDGLAGKLGKTIEPT